MCSAVQWWRVGGVACRSISEPVLLKLSLTCLGHLGLRVCLDMTSTLASLQSWEAGRGFRVLGPFGVTYPSITSRAGHFLLLLLHVWR